MQIISTIFGLSMIIIMLQCASLQDCTLSGLTVISIVQLLNHKEPRPVHSVKARVSGYQNEAKKMTLLCTAS